MKKISITFLFISLIFILNAQYRLVYESFSIGSTDTSFIEVLVFDNQAKISSLDPQNSNPIPGIAEHFTYIDYQNDTAYYQLFYSENEQYFSGIRLKNDNIYTEEKSEKVGKYSCKKYSTSLFSNRMEIWTTEDLKIKASPSTTFANLNGVVVNITRNGNFITRLRNVEKKKITNKLIPNSLGTKTDNRTINNLEKEKLTITIPVFNEDQICFNTNISKPTQIPFDTAIALSNGTVIIKRLNLGKIPEHYQIFAEIEEQSNGDAYDRTGSIFVIPTNNHPNFLDALLKGIDQLPIFTDKNGENYQGIKAENNYQPIVELVRFFTPFGVKHFNKYRSLSNRDWEDFAYYKQDISDLRNHLSGDVYIGAFIGNYDGGGHKLSLTLKAYPENFTWDTTTTKSFALPLFNTCNVMEMSSQNYGQFFSTDSLTVEFSIPEGLNNLKLRYITTGHGGWENGDEFVPKENVIIIDGKRCFKYTPWRSDCGTFRTLNPASGNFWNGMSSSDYSRSGWCPGTATQPVYFDISDLEPGKHTITIAIPQGPREGNYFSAWNVSGILVGEYK